MNARCSGNTVMSVAYVAGAACTCSAKPTSTSRPSRPLLANPGVNLDALRPYKGYNSIRETDNVASSMYNSFQLSWNRRFAKGLLVRRGVHVSKSMDDGSAQRDIIPDTYDAHNLWGQSDFDVRHIMIINYIYELPFFRSQHNFAGKVLGGWQLSGITQFQTGTPCSVATSNDYAGVGQDGSMSQWRPVLDTEWHSHASCIRLRPTAAVEAKYWFSDHRLQRQSAFHGAGHEHLQHPAAGFATPSTTPVSRTGTSVSSRSSRVHREDRLPVPRRGVQRV